MTKAPPSDVAERLIRLVHDFPGLHLREIARQLDLSEALTGYHADQLVAQGRLRSDSEAGYRRFYPVGPGERPSAADRHLLALLRQPQLLRILLLLMARGRMTHPALVDALAMSKSSVSYQLNKLVAGGLVHHAEPEGFAIADKARLEQALLRWKPTQDFADRFANLWSTFYPPRKRK